MLTSLPLMTGVHFPWTWCIVLPPHRPVVPLLISSFKQSIAALFWPLFIYFYLFVQTTSIWKSAISDNPIIEETNNWSFCFLYSYNASGKSTLFIIFLLQINNKISIIFLSTRPIFELTFFFMAVIFILQIQPNFILKVIMFQTMFKICLENAFHYHSMSVLVCHVCKLLNEKIMKIYD